MPSSRTSTGNVATPSSYPPGGLPVQRVVVPAVPGAAQPAVLDGALAERTSLVGHALSSAAVLSLVVSQRQALVSCRNTVLTRPSGSSVRDPRGYQFSALLAFIAIFLRRCYSGLESGGTSAVGGATPAYRTPERQAMSRFQVVRSFELNWFRCVCPQARASVAISCTEARKRTVQSFRRLLHDQPGSRRSLASASRYPTGQLLV